MTTHSLLEWLAMKLAILSTDCCTAIYFTGGKIAGSHFEQWQLAIDTIIQLYNCGLIESDAADGGSSSLSDWEAYLKRLTACDPFDGNVDNYVVWMEWDFCGTVLLHETVRRFELNSIEPDWSGFKHYINNLFLRHEGPIMASFFKIK